VSPSPDSTHRWLQTLLPLARDGGPIVSLLLGVLFVASLWWGLGALRECVERNRMLGEKLVTQQEKFYAEVMLRLAHCQPR
jgi:hypothetical protein